MKAGFFFNRAAARTLISFLLVALLGPLPLDGLSNTPPSTKTATDRNGRIYEYVPGDPLEARIYTLENGITVYLSVYRETPRIYTSIGFRVGGKNDPADNTGMAHYLEHMLFKGTDQLGSLNFEQEKQYLDQIEAAYEDYNSTTDSTERKLIYRRIDSLSQLAAQHAIPNEYDRLISQLGGKGTNAFTTFEETVYINDIPANQLERWLKLEGERFSNPQMRLFHTDLETVYEEKNRAIDNAYRRQRKKMMELLFPSHPYGQQTVLGKMEHLKNPSLKVIQEYFRTYYRPNNMAIAMAGDLDPAQTVELIEQYFGGLEEQSTPAFAYNGPEPVLPEVKRAEVITSESENVALAFRLPGNGHPDLPALSILDAMLSNGQAGLIDLNLVQKQAVVSARSYLNPMQDYSMLQLTAEPLEGQRLEELEELLLEQIELLKAGDFAPDLVEACIKNYKVSRIRQLQSNRARAFEMVFSFTKRTSWAEHQAFQQQVAAVTPEDIIRVAKKYFSGGYAAVYRRNGEEPDLPKIAKPEITPIEINREDNSAFYHEVLERPTQQLEPLFVDFEEDFANEELSSGLPFLYKKNENNELFTLYYVLDIGTHHDREFPIAMEYLDFLGSESHSATEIKRKMFALGCYYGVFPGKRRSYVYLGGLQESFDEAVAVFEELIRTAQPDEEAYQRLVARILKNRQDAKLEKYRVFRALSAYGAYEGSNPILDQLPEEELRAMAPRQLTKMLHSIPSYPHKVLYYGPASEETVADKLAALHPVPASLRELPERKVYKYRKPSQRKIYFVHQDMVQAQIAWLGPSGEWDPELVPLVSLFNEYYGGGMSSVVFQELREAQALAYSSYARFQEPSYPDEPFRVYGYIGTQADKLSQAINSMDGLLNEFLTSEEAFAAAKVALREKLRATRTVRTRVLFTYLDAQDLNLDYDIRARVYEELDNYTLEDLQAFHQEYVRNKSNVLVVMGDRERVDLEALGSFGEVEEVSPEEIFGY